MRRRKILIGVASAMLVAAVVPPTVQRWRSSDLPCEAEILNAIVAQVEGLGKSRVRPPDAETVRCLLRDWYFRHNQSGKHVRVGDWELSLCVFHPECSTADSEVVIGYTEAIEGTTGDSLTEMTCQPLFLVATPLTRFARLRLALAQFALLRGCRWLAAS